jgi:hypothetical protein
MGELASAQVALVRASAFAGIVTGPAREDVLNASGNSGVELMMRILRNAESSGPAAVRGVSLSARGDELFSAVQRYLGQLESTQDLDAATDWQSKAERYRGRKEVIEELLNVLQNRSERTDIRAAVEIALFNVGVRHIGEAGDEVSFDPNRHQPIGSGIVPGEPAAIVEPGRCIGDQADAVVLVKARVQALR